MKKILILIATILITIYYPIITVTYANDYDRFYQQQRAFDEGYIEAEEDAYYDARRKHQQQLHNLQNQRKPVYPASTITPEYLNNKNYMYNQPPR